MGDEDFRIRSEYARKSGRDYDDPKTLDEAKEFSREMSDLLRDVAPPDIGSDRELWEIAEQVYDECPGVEVLFGGGAQYIDTVYVQYNDVPDEDDFEEYMVLHFKYWLEEDPDDNAGICPTCDDRVTMARGNYRDDDKLLAEPDEFDFREYPDYGKVCRMWWD